MRWEKVRDIVSQKYEGLSKEYRYVFPYILIVTTPVLEDGRVGVITRYGAIK